jgi:hypothetical protein
VFDAEVFLFTLHAVIVTINAKANKCVLLMLIMGYN